MRVGRDGEIVPEFISYCFFFCRYLYCENIILYGKCLRADMGAIEADLACLIGCLSKDFHSRKALVPSTKFSFSVEVFCLYHLSSIPSFAVQNPITQCKIHSFAKTRSSSLHSFVPLFAHQKELPLRIITPPTS